MGCLSREGEKRKVSEQQRWDYIVSEPLIELRALSLKGDTEPQRLQIELMSNIPLLHMAMDPHNYLHSRLRRRHIHCIQARQIRQMDKRSRTCHSLQACKVHIHWVYRCFVVTGDLCLDQSAACDKTWVRHGGLHGPVGH